jgi:hypothetical protein
MKKNGIFMLTALFLAIISAFSSCAVRNGAAADYDKNDPTTWCTPKPEIKITDKKIGSIKKGMTFIETVELIGNPQRNVGSGAIIFEWDMPSGKKLQITYADTARGYSDTPYAERFAAVAMYEKNGDEVKVVFNNSN